MQIAILTDIHGNQHALEAVLKDLAHQPVDFVVFGGDVALFGSRPSECWELVRSKGWPCVQGNTDRYILDLPTKLEELGAAESAFGKFLAENVAWARSQIGPEEARYLGAMETEVCIDSSAGRVHVVHGVPGNDEVGIKPSDDDGKIEATLSHIEATVLVCAHTHTAFVRHVGRALVVNCGSIGRTHDGIPGIATYALLDDGGNRWSASIRRIPYNHLEAHAEIYTRGVPLTNAFANTLLTGLQPT